MHAELLIKTCSFVSKLWVCGCYRNRRKQACSMTTQLPSASSVLWIILHGSDPSSISQKGNRSWDGLTQLAVQGHCSQCQSVSRCSKKRPFLGFFQGLLHLSLWAEFQRARWGGERMPLLIRTTTHWQNPSKPASQLKHTYITAVGTPINTEDTPH